MNPKNILDQNTRTVISMLKKGDYNNMELDEILESENKNRKREKIINFLKKLFLKKEEAKIVVEALTEKENKSEKRVKEIKAKIIKEKKETLIDFRDNKGELIKLKLLRESGGYKEYINEKTNKKYSLGF